MPLVRRSARRFAGVVVAGLLVALGAVGAQSAHASNDPCATGVNVIACENSKEGNPPSEWDIRGAGDSDIQGFSTDISVDLGQQISFKIKTPATSYRIDIYRLGWYNGDGARKWDSITPTAQLPQDQPDCITDPATQLYDCGNWSVSATWTVPSDAVSGVYIAHLVRTDDTNHDDSQIPFIVRDDSSHSDILFQTSDPTWEAYNIYGGADFYAGADPGRAFKLSYNRPFATRGNVNGRDYLFSNEYPMIRFMERNGYDVSYTSGIDSDRHGDLIKNHKVFTSTGHDEYWSGDQRANVEAARDAGVNLAFFSGNEVYWKTRYEPSTDGSATPYRTLVCYKETWSNAKIDPSPEWTGTYRDPRFTPPSNGGRPENALTGTAYMSNSDDLPIQVPGEEGNFRFWRETDAAGQAPDQTLTLAQHTIGYESDEDLDNGFRPAGLIDLSTTVGDTPQYLQDFGNLVAAGTTTHHLTLYRAPSGALVFGAGTVQWAWGLDDQHDGTQSPPDKNMQQATVNLFADMGAPATTLMSQLKPVTASTDIDPATVTVTSPANGTSVPDGAAVHLEGTATDQGGGRVAMVEVSTDGGTTWNRATGTTDWSYTLYAAGSGTEVVQVRAIDDSVNLPNNPTTLDLALTGPHSLFGQRVPNTPASSDVAAAELGVKVIPRNDGYITGVRFYKGTGNIGTHTGNLWSSTGTRLATGTFTNETATGWQTLTFPSPVPVVHGTTYVASYRAPTGHYAADSWAFAYLGRTAGPLLAPRSGDAGGNGVYGTAGTFPNRTYQATNYYVDVTFVGSEATSDDPPMLISTAPSDATTEVPVTAKTTAVFSKALDPGTAQLRVADQNDVQVDGSVCYDDTVHSVTFTPTAPLAAAQTYHVTANVRDPQGHPTTVSWSFTTEVDPTVDKLFKSDAVPAAAAETDSAAVALGVKFTPSVNGTVVGVRYFQGAGNTGTHTGSLYSAGGALLARLTFPTSTTVGWQMARFSAPVAVTAGSTYVVSYFAPNGHYAATANFFASPYSNGPLSALSGNNGVYQYGSDAFPRNTYGSTNYWVDPLFIVGGTVPPPTQSPSPSPSPVTPPPALPSGAVTVFTDDSAPTTINYADPSSITLGMKFSSNVNGQVLGVRFYKGPQNTGPHTGSLWNSAGTLLASATFTDESANGWQMVLFSQPVSITAGSVYYVSYNTTAGYYSVSLNGLSTSVTNGHLTVGAPGGRYRYGTGYPNGSAAHNYWVDVVFKPNS